MRVGVVTPRHPASVGGGFTFHTAVLKALERVSSHHEFVLLDLGSSGGGPWVSEALQVIDVQGMAAEQSQASPAICPAGAAKPLETGSPGGEVGGKEAANQGVDPAADPNDEHAAKSAEVLVPAYPIEFAAYKLGLDVIWYLDPPADALSVPVFVTVYDLAHRQYPFFPEVSGWDWDWESRENYFRRVLPRAARVFVGTQAGKEQIVRFYAANPENIIVNPFPTPALPDAGPEHDDKVLARYSLGPGYLFYPAQFWPHKNHVNLLLGIKHLEAEHGIAPHVVFTGSDQGNMAFVRRVTEELDLQERVFFLGFIPADEMAAFYRHAAALVFPSLFGPDNLPPLEAFSIGCPVLAARVEGAAEQLGKHAAGFFDPTRPEDIAQAMARVLTNSRYRKGLTKNGRLRATKYTPESYVGVVLSTLDDFEPWRRNWSTAKPRWQ